MAGSIIPIHVQYTLVHLVRNAYLYIHIFLLYLTDVYLYKAITDSTASCNKTNH